LKSFLCGHFEKGWTIYAINDDKTNTGSLLTGFMYQFGWFSILSATLVVVRMNKYINRQEVQEELYL
jgi:hypothetical protein